MTTLRKMFARANIAEDGGIVDALRAEYAGVTVRGEGVVYQPNAYSLRRAEMAGRLALYRDDFAAAVERLIDAIWTHPTVKADRRRMAHLVGFLNVPKRITDEVASLYDEPAKRKFSDEATTTRFAAVAKELQLDAVMKEAHRLSFWLNDVLLWLNEPATESAEPDDPPKRSLRIVTPDAFDVVPNFLDPLDMVAVILHRAPAWVPYNYPRRNELPHYEVWDAEIKITLDANWMLCDPQILGAQPIEEHGLGRIPGVLMSARLPVDRLLDCRPGRDIESAAKAVLFLNLLTVTLSQTSGEPQPYFKGNLAALAADQPQTAGRPLGLPPDVEPGVLDLVKDPEHLLKVVRHVIASVAQAYGMSYEQFTFQETADTASGKAYTVRRQKLNELRREQRGRAEVHEPEVAELLGFNGDDLRVDYHDQTAPMDPLEEHALFVQRMNRGLDDPIAKRMREDTDLSRADAEAEIVDHVAVASWLFNLLRAGNISLDATTANPGQPPAANGAMAQNPDPGAMDPATQAAPAGMMATAANNAGRPNA